MSQENNNQPKRRLTKEELMAGKCEPDDLTNNDPRLKSPDDLLLRLLAQKKGPNGAKPVSQVEAVKIEKTAMPMEEGKPVFKIPSPKSNESLGTFGEPEILKESAENEAPDRPISAEVKVNLEDLQNKKWLALKEMYDRDMTRWREYEQNVTHWRDKVLQIVHRLQNELAHAKGLHDEVDALKSVIKAKDEEMAKMKKTLVHSIKNKTHL